MSVGPTELLVILAILLLLFGGSRLPKLARSLGQAKHELEASRSLIDDEASPAPAVGLPAPDRAERRF